MRMRVVMRGAPDTALRLVGTELLSDSALSTYH
jgi:hypothetical protein